MSNKPKWKDPGIVLTIIMSLYAKVVFFWWPTDIYWLGVSLIGWLMFFGLFIWMVLGFIYVFWVEKLDKQKSS